MAGSEEQYSWFSEVPQPVSWPAGYQVLPPSLRNAPCEKPRIARRSVDQMAFAAHFVCMFARVATRTGHRSTSPLQAWPQSRPLAAGRAPARHPSSWRGPAGEMRDNADFLLLMRPSSFGVRSSRLASHDGCRSNSHPGIPSSAWPPLPRRSIRTRRSRMVASSRPCAWGCPPCPFSTCQGELWGGCSGHTNSAASPNPPGPSHF